jgi:hypothetical protein
METNPITRRSYEIHSLYDILMEMCSRLRDHEGSEEYRYKKCFEFGKGNEKP